MIRGNSSSRPIMRFETIEKGSAVDHVSPNNNEENKLLSHDTNMDDHDAQKTAAAAAKGGLEDRMSMGILLVLYTLQGIPMGLCGSIPLIMKERGVSYEGLSLFSLVSVPFSLKLFWAPLVDSLYFKDIGRRKTWLIPVQILTGTMTSSFRHHGGAVSYYCHLAL